MKRIKNLTVTVTYTVCLSDIEVNEKVFDAIKALAYRGYVDCNNEQMDTAFDWFGDNIYETDSCDWECEIKEMEEYENEQGNTDN